jgi:hypothetical protein
MARKTRPHRLTDSDRSLRLKLLDLKMTINGYCNRSKKPKRQGA